MLKPALPLPLILAIAALYPVPLLLPDGILLCMSTNNGWLAQNRCPCRLCSCGDTQLVREDVP